MKKRSLLSLPLWVASFMTLSSGQALAAVDISNGSFEAGTHGDGPFDTLGPGSTAITGWTIESGTIDWIGTYWQPAGGNRSVDLNGGDAGTISQTLMTSVGVTYEVKFALSGNPEGGPTENVKTLLVSASGADPIQYTFDTAVSGNSLMNMNWVTETYTFVATSPSTALRFASTTPGRVGPALDRVEVSEVVTPTPTPTPTGEPTPTPTIDPSPSPSPSPTPNPSPSPSPTPNPSPTPTPSPTPSPTIGDTLSRADCRHGGWRTMEDSIGNGFKNQGDCVSYVATDGRNHASPK